MKNAKKPYKEVMATMGLNDNAKAKKVAATNGGGRLSQKDDVVTEVTIKQLP